MTPTLKPLREQVILITGASSGIGLTTARVAAGRGAKVLLVARSEEALRSAAEHIRQSGGEADFAVADVADMGQLRLAAERAVERWGRIDTWVNNAGVSIFGQIRDVNVRDDRRLFETNFWGVVNGSRLALEFLKNGGALINVGSVVSDRAVPVQGMYSASKHAVLGFTDALRVEVQKSNLPISVTLIKPAAINTPFPAHAKNYMDVKPTLPAPVYTPSLVADAILYAATTPTREQYVGGGGRVLAGLGRQLPSLMDWLQKKFFFQQQRSNRPAGRNRAGALYQPSEDEREQGDADRERTIRTHSVYGSIMHHPVLSVMTIAALGALGVVAAVMLTDHKPRTPMQKLNRIGQRAMKHGRQIASSAIKHAASMPRPALVDQLTRRFR